MEDALASCLTDPSHAPVRLHTAMRYATLGGGKRVRPLLVMAAGEVSGAETSSLIRAACSVELIHVYSLVHDDLPCMDDDDLRRGKPTCHIAFDEATAMLVGDALQSLAFEQLAAPGDLPAEKQLRMCYLLAQASGAGGMCGGQAIDLAAVGKALNQTELEYMHILKTGALIRASVLLGAHCGDADDALIKALDHYAKTAGLLFQVVDDVLDSEANTATLGKTAGKDAAQNKPTYVSLLGTSGAKSLADELEARALETLAQLPNSTRLQELTHFICHRSF